MLKKNTFLCDYLPILLFGTGLLLRVVLAYFNMGFPNDTACFAGWSERMFSVGPGGFYASDMFTDYPPLLFSQPAVGTGCGGFLYPLGGLPYGLRHCAHCQSAENSGTLSGGSPGPCDPHGYRPEPI